MYAVFGVGGCSFFLNTAMFWSQKKKFRLVDFHVKLCWCSLVKFALTSRNKSLLKQVYGHLDSDLSRQKSSVQVLAPEANKRHTNYRLKTSLR